MKILKVHRRLLAERYGVCGLCDVPVRPGDPICKCPGLAWSHERCINAWNRRETGNAALLPPSEHRWY